METDEVNLDTPDVIEEYLIRTEFPFEQVDEGFWLIHDEFDQIDNIVVYYSPPVVTFRVKLLNVPDLDDDVKLELFTKLLELNATSMVAGAYGLENDAVVVVDTLQAESLDFNDFQASIDSMALAIREHYRPLKRLITGESPPGAEGSEPADLDELLGEGGEHPASDISELLEDESVEAALEGNLPESDIDEEAEREVEREIKKELEKSNSTD